MAAEQRPLPVYANTISCSMNEPTTRLVPLPLQPKTIVGILTPLYVHAAPVLRLCDQDDLSLYHKMVEEIQVAQAEGSKEARLGFQISGAQTTTST